MQGRNAADRPPQTEGLSPPPAPVPADVAPEDILRAHAYRLLARFLSAPPSAADLRWAAALQSDDTPFGKAVSAFARVCARTTVQAASDEYHTLFIGLTRGELVPYGSYYLSGFLHEKPLAKLRGDMQQLGIARDPAMSDPEDHIASELEIMAGLIDGSYGPPPTLAAQQRFFEVHIGSWAPYFFRDLAGAQSSLLYAALGAIGSAFLAIEESAFRMS
ncbi:MAG: TorD/DmsD family molecular chaperone [Hyphomicrobiaceae bacterium]